MVFARRFLQKTAIFASVFVPEAKNADFGPYFAYFRHLRPIWGPVFGTSGEYWQKGAAGGAEEKRRGAKKNALLASGF